MSDKINNLSEPQQKMARAVVSRRKRRVKSEAAVMNGSKKDANKFYGNKDKRFL